MKKFLLNLVMMLTSRGFLPLLVGVYAVLTLSGLVSSLGDVEEAYSITWKHPAVFALLAVAYFRAGVVFARRGVARG